MLCKCGLIRFQASHYPRSDVEVPLDTCPWVSLLTCIYPAHEKDAVPSKALLQHPEGALEWVGGGAVASDIVAITL